MSGLDKVHAVEIFSHPSTYHEQYIDRGPANAAFPKGELHRSTSEVSWSGENDQMHMNPNDHLTIINDSPMSSNYSKEKANVVYQADPFAYASSTYSRNANSRRFEGHAQTMAQTFPSTAVANREDLINNVRLKGRQTIKAIEGGNVDAAIVDLNIGNAGNVIQQAVNGGGVVGLMATGHAAAAVAGAPIYAATLAVTSLVQRLAREARMTSVLSDVSSLHSRANTVLPDARADRNVYLEKIDDKLKNSTKEGIIEIWDKTDRLLPRYLNSLNRISYGGSYLPKKLANSGTTLMSYELKGNLAAEERFLKRIQSEVKS